MSVPPKVAVVFYNIGPYHHARLNAAAERMPTVALEWSALESYPWGRSEIPARYEKRTLLAEHLNTAPSRAMLRNLMYDVLSDVRPNVLAINGWNDFGALETLWCALRADIPVVVMSESSEQDMQRNRWKEWIKHRIVALYSAALVGGRLHREYLQQLGMPAERIFTGYDVVDNAHFAPRMKIIKNGASVLSADQHQNLTPDRGGESSPCFLASARFIEKKNLFTLVNAYAEYRRAIGEGGWKLILLGDGPLRSALNSQVSTLNLHSWVQMPGFKQYDELPQWYARAGAFVHASTSEQWGLVVNEALAAGLPVIVSNHCGCVPELVQEGVNGFTFDPHNVHALATLMHRVSAMTQTQRDAMGHASISLVNTMSPARFADGLEAAARLALKCRSEPSKLWDRILLNVLIRR